MESPSAESESENYRPSSPMSGKKSKTTVASYWRSSRRVGIVCAAAANGIDGHCTHGQTQFVETGRHRTFSGDDGLCDCSRLPLSEGTRPKPRPFHLVATRQDDFNGGRCSGHFA